MALVIHLAHHAKPPGRSGGRNTTTIGQLADALPPLTGPGWVCHRWWPFRYRPLPRCSVGPLAMRRTTT